MYVHTTTTYTYQYCRHTQHILHHMYVCTYCHTCVRTRTHAHTQHQNYCLMRLLLPQVVVPSDITDLLLHEDSSLPSLPSSTSVVQSASDPTPSIDGYRKLLLEGRRKVCGTHVYCGLCVYCMFY